MYISAFVRYICRKKKNLDKMTYLLVPCGTIERIKAIGKNGETFDDVVTTLLDFYEDLCRQDWINKSSWKLKDAQPSGSIRS